MSYAPLPSQTICNLRRNSISQRVMRKPHDLTFTQTIHTNPNPTRKLIMGQINTTFFKPISVLGMGPESEIWDKWKISCLEAQEPPRLKLSNVATWDLTIEDVVGSGQSSELGEVCNGS